MKGKKRINLEKWAFNEFSALFESEKWSILLYKGKDAICCIQGPMESCNDYSWSFYGELSIVPGHEISDIINENNLEARFLGPNEYDGRYFKSDKVRILSIEAGINTMIKVIVVVQNPILTHEDYEDL